MDRRAFFKFSWGALGVGALISAVGVSFAAVVRFLMPSVFYEPPQSLKIGNPGDFPFGPPTFLVEEKIFVFRDRDKGFAVASAVCTHLGCTVAHFSSDQKFHCPCHGSVPLAAGSRFFPRRAGWIYAVAGWLGSAMGIGMGQHLGYVPPVFVLAASAVVILPRLIVIARHRAREIALTAAVALIALFLDRALLPMNASTQLSQVERGRQVYISEGCIHCHSQYIRPNSPGVLMWGPVETMQELRQRIPRSLAIAARAPTCLRLARAARPCG